MKTLIEIINEKLKISSKTKSSIANYWYDEYPDDDKMPKDFYNHRKLKRGDTNKNRPWYAVYLYLRENGPSRKDDIKKALWPNGTAQQAELFSGMINYNIVKSIKGTYHLQDYKDWAENGTCHWNYKLYTP